MTVLLNFLGSPGVGKTTLSAAVFAKLKSLGIETEYTPEYVKGWVYDGRAISPFDQYYLFGQEVLRQSRLFNKVDVVISDSPVMLAAFYQYHYNGKNTLRIPCHDFYDTAEKVAHVEIVNFVLPRRKEYNPNWRYQTKEESDAISELLKTWLNFEGYSYYELKCDDTNRVEEVLEVLRLNKVLTEEKKVGV